MTTLVDKIVAIHTALQAEGLPHDFGGALALAWCTQRARGTIDMAAAGCLDVDEVANTLADYLGPDDERIARLRALPS